MDGLDPMIRSRRDLPRLFSGAPADRMPHVHPVGLRDLPMTTTNVPDDIRADVMTLWKFLRMDHEPRPADVGIGLGSHDHTVPEVAVDLFRRGLFPYLVFTGANAPTTVERFPRGEAVHFGEYAVEHGVPADLLALETRATTTAENIRFSRELLAELGRDPRSVVLMSRPYQQRRAWGICRKLWPEVEVVCAATALPLDEYVEAIGSADRVVSMMVGDVQRIGLDTEHGFAVAQDVPETVMAAYDRLIGKGYTGRLIPSVRGDRGAGRTDSV